MSKTKERIHDSNLRYKQGLGQNFIYDEDLLAALVASSEITKEDDVLEIGPGAGSMTKYLCDAAHHVLSIELDERLIPLLTAFLAERDNFTLVQGDVMTLNLADVTKDLRKPLSVVANIPYYITTPLLTMLLASPIPIQRMALMVQKEVADRMQVGPGTKDYGALSLAVQYYAKPEIVANVPPNCFIPRPNVGSAVIRLTRYEEPPVQVKDEKKMFALIRASFNQRRKTLVNGLGNAGLPGITKESAAAALTQMGLSPTVRGEALTLEQFARLSDLL
mgnify:CR=1 FL=1